MKFQSPGLECESPTRQRILRVAITVAMVAVQCLISAVMLVLVMSGMGVQGLVVPVAGQEGRIPGRGDERKPGLPELNSRGLNIEATATRRKQEEDLSLCVLKVIGR